MVNVAHDGHHWRTLLKRLFATFILTKLQVEGFEQLTVLVLRRDDLYFIVDLSAEQLQRLFRDRLRCRHHLTEVEQRLDQVRCFGTDLVSEVRQGGTLAQTHGLATAVWQTYTTNDVWCVHLLVLGALLTLRLTSTTRCTAWTAECACGTATTSAAATTVTITRATWATLATTSAARAALAATTTASNVCGLGWHLGWRRVCRHIRRRWTASLTLTSALAALARSTTTAATLLVAATAATWARCGTLPARV